MKLRETFKKLIRPYRENIKIFIDKGSLFLLCVALIFWFFQFTQIFYSAVLNTGLEQHIQLSDRNIRGLRTILWTVLTLFIFWTLRLRWVQKISTEVIIKEYIEISFKFLFLILEMALGLYVAAVIFIIKFDAYDPRLILTLIGLIAFYILEKSKSIIVKKYFISNKTESSIK